MAKDLLKNISLLSSGTVLAQVIPMLFAPVIARQYSSQSFGEYAAIVGILNIVSVVINGRYELAVVLPKHRIDGVKLVVGSWVTGLIVSSILVVLLLVFKENVSSFLEINFTIEYVVIVFIAMLSIAYWQPMNYWFIRNKSYGKMTSNKFVKSISGLLVTLLFGFFSINDSVNGLVMGVVAGWLVVSLFTHYQGSVFIFRRLGMYSRSLKTSLTDYIDYPKFNALPALLNSIASQLGLYLFVFHFSTEIAGHYSFSKQYLYVPLSILGMSLSQVFFQRISLKYKNRQSIKKELAFLFLSLFGLGLIISFVVVLFSEEIFLVLFGEQWNTAAKISKLLVFIFCVQFLVSPLSMVLHALRQVRLASVFPVVYLAFLVILYFVKFDSLYHFMSFYIWAEIIPYFIYIILIALAIYSYEKSLLKNKV